MMNTLLESRPRKKRSAGGTIFSVVLHSAIVFFAVYATARAGIPEDEKSPEQKVNFVSVKKEEPPPPVEKKKEEPPPPKVKKAEPKAPKVAQLPPAP
jgi:protein TonB